MKVAAIQNAVAEYKSYLQGKERFDRLYLYEVSQNLNHSFQKCDTALEAIETGLQSSTTQRLWKRHRYEPKNVLLQIGAELPDIFHHAIYDLFNENKLLENRVDRFKFYCDELLKQHREKNPRSNINHHYVDESFISILLMGKYPGTYAYYDHQLFLAVVELTGARPIPSVNDYPRFHKFVQIFNKFIHEDKKIGELHQSRSTDLDIAANMAVECMIVATDEDILS